MCQFISLIKSGEHVHYNCRYGFGGKIIFLLLLLLLFINRRVDDFSFSNCLSAFCLLLMNFIVLFPYLIKYYINMCIIIVF